MRKIVRNIILSSGLLLATTPLNAFAKDKYWEGNIKNEWVQQGTEWYYHNENGDYSKGWKYINLKWYYFNSDGVMQTGWLDWNGKRFYLNKNGSMATGYMTIGNKTFFFNRDGSLRYGWALEKDHNWYYVDKYGDFAKGWYKLDSNWYFFNQAGTMQTGWVDDNNNRYYMDKKSGVMRTGWINDKGNWFFLQRDGSMKKNSWVLDKGNWYYLQYNGTIKTGWLLYNGKWYYLGLDGGMMHYGLEEIGDDLYHFYEDGSMAQNAVILDYEFGENGAWTKVNEMTKLINADTEITEGFGVQAVGDTSDSANLIHGTTYIGHVKKNVHVIVQPEYTDLAVKITLLAGNISISEADLKSAIEEAKSTSKEISIGENGYVAANEENITIVWGK